MNPSETITATPSASVGWPIYRQAAIVSATNTIDGTKHRVQFEYTEMDAAIRTVWDLTPDFEASIIGALKKLGWTVGENSKEPTIPSNPARISRSIGAVVDFKEMHIQKNDLFGVVRCCVTVCVAPMDDPFKPIAEASMKAKKEKGPDLPLFSKLWFRVAWVSSEYASVETTDLPKIRQIQVTSEKLANSVLRAMYAPYKAVITLLMDKRLNRSLNKADISLTKVFAIKNLTLSTESHDFEELFRDAFIDGSVGLTAQQGKPASKTLKLLYDLAKSELPNERVRITTFDDSMFKFGVYQVALSKAAAFMAGLAYNRAAIGITDWQKSAGNAISVISSNRIASKL